MDYQVEMVREKFPALKREINGRKVIYFDGPSGTQVVNDSIHAMENYMKTGSANLGGQYVTSQDTESLVWQARLSVSDFLGGDPEEVAFGQNMTSLTFDISRALSRNWKSGDEVVVTEMDHRANVDPWIEAAKDKGVTIRWIKLDPEQLVLDLTNLNEIINERTVMVAIGHASNGIGTINDVREITRRAKEVGAISVMDAVHSAPHVFIDRDELGVDIIICSAYKFFGPHIGFASIRKDLFETLPVYRLSTASQAHPEKLETGTQSFESIAGLIGAIDFIAGLGTGQTRREMIKSAFEKIHNHENLLAERLRNELSQIDCVTLFQAKDLVPKTPTIAFRLDNQSPEEICAQLGRNGIFAGNGHFYAKTIGDVLDLNKDGGWIRIGMAPYNTMNEVNSFLDTLNKLVENKK